MEWINRIYCCVIQNGLRLFTKAFKMRDKNQKLSEADHRTYAFLKCVFPNEVSSEELFLLMYVLRHTGEMSFRAIAYPIAILMGSTNPQRDYVNYLHDTLKTESMRPEEHPEEIEVTKMRDRLYACGFAEWIEE
jgi:hypothetical protein